MKQINATALYILLLLLLSTTAIAQGPGFDDDVEDTPIDGGATLIAIAAAGYGIKKVYDRKQDNK